MTPRLLLSSSFAFLLVASLAAPAAAEAPPDLVVVAEPSATDALADPSARGPVTLTYRVVEIFAGEPGAASIVVRHDALAKDDRVRLRDGERVIVLARADAATPGRWVASTPLRATPSAVAAFRRWSAPEDVRAARPVSEVVAEVSHGTKDEAVPHREDAPAPVVAPKRAAAAAPAPVAAAPPAQVTAAAPTEVAMPEEAVVARREMAAKPAPKPAAPAAPRAVVAPAPVAAPTPAAAPVASAGAAAKDWDPPLLTEKAVPPGPGPGLPPAPSPEVLGPPLQERTDLKPPARGGRRR